MNIGKSIWITGNISAGKSTLLCCLEESMVRKNLIFIKEPLCSFQRYETISGQILNPLELYYVDIEHEALGFQLHVLDCYEKLLRQIKSKVSQFKSGEVVDLIWDRTLYDCTIFTQMLHKQGHIGTFSMQYWCDIYDKVLTEYKAILPTEVFHLNPPIDFCLSNCQKRLRKDEIKFNNMKEYMKSLQTKYNEYLNKHEDSYLQLVHAECTEKCDRVKLFKQTMISF